LVVLVLAIVWVAVLTPKVVRRFREAGSQSSIDSFHQQLHLLERAGPKLVAPAYRLETGDDATAGGGASSSAQVPFRRAGRVTRSGLVLVDDEGPVGAAPGWTAAVRRRRLANDRRRSRKRRRDLLVTLLGIAALTGVLGAMHALHLLWAITAVSVLALAAYVALAAYAQLLTADRQAARPIAAPPMPATPAWAARAQRQTADDRLAGVDAVAAGTRQAARAGYPGAWDREAYAAELASPHAAAR